MKSVFVSISTIALFSSAITAAPTRVLERDAPATSASISFQNGDGDSSVGFSVPLKQLFPTNPNELQAEKGISASTDAGLFCQAFSDGAGQTKLGSVFSQTKVFFTDSTVGGTTSVSSDAVPVGAFCCDTANPPVCEGSSTSTSINSGENNSASGSAAGSAPPTTTTSASSSTSTATVRVEIQGDNGESGAQGEVRVDGVLQVLTAPFFSEVDAAFIVDSEGAHKPTCQAFADEAGTKAVGKPFGLELEQLNGNTGKNVVVKSMKCKRH